MYFFLKNFLHFKSFLLFFINDLFLKEKILERCLNDVPESYMYTKTEKN